MPTVSVIISTYNRANYLENTIKSILCQTFRDFEVLVCDDGSDDNTEELVRSLIKHDSRVRYFNCGHNGRPAIPRNVGIQNAKGEWLAFDDDDDEWNPVKLEVQLYQAEKKNIKAICTNAFIVEKGINTGRRYFESEGDRIYTLRDLIDVNPIINSSMMIHRSLLDFCVGYPEGEDLKAVEDYAFWKRIAVVSPILYISLPLTRYLMTSSSSIRLKKSQSFEDQRRIVDNDFHKWLMEQALYLRLQVIKEMFFYKVRKKRDSILSYLRSICL